MVERELRPLPVGFYARPTEVVARELVGKRLVRRTPDGQILLARVVEVEAYLGLLDGASHARRGPTPRSAIMFGPPGRLYVYLIYGMHHCMNFVAKENDGSEAVAGAVLIRAAEPIHPLLPARAMAGPGKLCAALGITLGDKGLDLTAPESPFFATEEDAPVKITASARVGVDYAGVWARRKLRFYVKGNPSVSGSPR